MHVLRCEVASPDAEDRNGNEPVRKQDGDCFFDEARGRCVMVHPAEVGADKTGDDPRFVFVERAAVGKNGGKLEDSVPQALQMILKGEIDGYEQGGHDEVDFGRWKSGGGMQEWEYGGVGD